MPAAGVVTANLLAEYQFVGVGSGTTVSDTSGNGNTLTLGPSGSAVITATATSQVAPTWQSDGLLFDNATNTVATMADNSVVSTSTTNFTAEIWLKPTAQVSGCAYFNFGYNDHELSDNSNTTSFWPDWGTSWNNSGGFEQFQSLRVTTPFGDGFADGSWYQLVVTREPSTGKMTSYINGGHENDNWTFGGTGAFDTNGFAFSTSAPDGLTASRTIGGDCFDGDGVSALFGEIRFYGSVLSDADVLQNYNARALAVTGSAPATPRKPSSGLSGGMKPLMNGGLNA